MAEPRRGAGAQDHFSVFCTWGEPTQPLLDFRQAMLSRGRPERRNEPSDFDKPDGFHVVFTVQRKSSRSVVAAASGILRHRQDGGQFASPYVQIHSVCSRAGLGREAVKLAIAIGVAKGAQGAALDSRMEERVLDMYLGLGFVAANHDPHDVKKYSDGHITKRMELDPFAARLLAKQVEGLEVTELIDKVPNDQLFDAGSAYLLPEIRFEGGLPHEVGPGPLGRTRDMSLTSVRNQIS